MVQRKQEILRISVIIIALLFVFNSIFCQTDVTTRFDVFYISEDSTVRLNQKVNNKKEGWWIKKNFLGYVVEIAQYSNGKKNGECYRFFHNGRLKFMGSFLDNKRHDGFDFYSRKSEAYKYYIIYENGRKVEKGFSWYK